jgi:hypothetical protein
VKMGESDLIGLEEPWTRLHRRVLETPGAIIDLGCATWDWSRRFFGTKRVVGADPFETDPKIVGVDLFQGVVTTVRGRVLISREGNGSSTRSTSNAVEVEAITFADLLDRHHVDEVAALKINTEGSEYELLIAMSEKQLARIDQIAVSFHDFNGLGSPAATEAVISFLSRWYDVASIDDRWSWYLLVRRR